ncbi:MAG: hypothetical protein LKG27_06510 [Clostridiaceae bacterium]|jgi:hypothetical protein|nr:hypothetical protein [Clostridiaceae bacterium]
MASIKDAIEESFIETSSFPKYIILGSLVYVNYQLFMAGNGFAIPLAILNYILLTGFMLRVSHNVRNCANHILPSFNPIPILISGLKGLLALGPSILLNSFLGKVIGTVAVAFILTHAQFSVSNAVMAIIVYCIIGALFMSFIYTSYVLYIKNFKIAEAYDVQIIWRYSSDVLVGVFVFYILGTLANIIFIGGATYLFWILAGLPNPYCTFVWCMAIPWNCAVAGNYLAQIGYESIEAKSDSDL